MSQCCLSGFEWDGKPTGTEIKIGNNDTYVVGSNKEVSWSEDPAARNILNGHIRLL